MSGPTTSTPKKAVNDKYQPMFDQTISGLAIAVSAAAMSSSSNGRYWRPKYHAIKLITLTIAARTIDGLLPVMSKKTPISPSENTKD